MKFVVSILVLVVLGGTMAQDDATEPPVDPCADNPCGVGQCKVANTASFKYRCICPLGYKENAGTCDDVNECKMPGKVCGGRGSICTNTVGSFECTCSGKFYWDGYQCVKKGRNRDCPDGQFPEFLVKPQEQVKLELGDELKLTCVGAGHPAPNVYWTKGVNRKRMGPMTTSTSIFYLPNVTKADIDVYECVLEDCCSGRIARAKVDLSVPSEPCANPSLKLYGMVWEYKTWDQAKAFCEEKGLIMGVVRSEEDRRIMKQDAYKSYLFNPNAKKFANEYWAWIGASDREEEGDFRTVEGESVESFANWLPGTPDNWLQLDPENGQDVVAAHRMTGMWDDSYSFHLRPFACGCPTKESTPEEGGDESSPDESA